LKKIKIAVSTCPNDTFAFYALLRDKLDGCPFSFEEHFADIEELNISAFNGNFHITKISFNALGYLTDRYVLLDTGSALGDNCGPILVSKNHYSMEELKGKAIGLPGKYTTANFLFKIASDIDYQENFQRFDTIMPSILSGDIDAGVIIHESRFTYKTLGLKLILDLGEWWEKESSLPIPLGGIAVSSELGEDFIKTFDKFLKLSIKYAFEHFEEAKAFAKEYSKETDNSVIESHIKLYVNEYTYSLSKKGVDAVKFFMKKGMEKGIFKNNNLIICGANGYLSNG